MTSSGRSLDYSHTGILNWMPTEQSSSSSGKPSDMGSGWRTYSQESPIVPSFSSYTATGPSSTGWNVAEPSPREELAWPPYSQASRPMSFGGEGLAPIMSQNPAGPGRPYDRRSSTLSTDVYPASIATSVTSVDTTSTGSTMAHSVTMSAGSVPSPSYSTWQQPYHYTKPADSYGNWEFGETNANQPSSSREQAPPPAEGEAPPGSLYYPTQ
jgi:hypothetical protein